jgi:transcriptional regulator with XRE-family HTH domain
MKRTSRQSDLSTLVGDLLHSARRESNITREQLARRAGVSTRLVGELERGQRPNVSLKSALKLLNLVGATVVLKSPGGMATEIADSATANLQRSARAAVRRKNWTGRQIPLHEEQTAPRGGRLATTRLAAVAAVSRAGFAMSRSRQTGR